MDKRISIAIAASLLALSLSLSAPAATDGKAAGKRPTAAPGNTGVSTPPAGYNYSAQPRTGGPTDASPTARGRSTGLAPGDTGNLDAPPTARGRSAGLAPADAGVLDAPPAVPASPPRPVDKVTQPPRAGSSVAETATVPAAPAPGATAPNSPSSAKGSTKPSSLTSDISGAPSDSNPRDTVSKQREAGRPALRSEPAPGPLATEESELGTYTPPAPSGQGTPVNIAPSLPKGQSPVSLPSGQAKAAPGSDTSKVGQDAGERPTQSMWSAAGGKSAPSPQEAIQSTANNVDSSSAMTTDRKTTPTPTVHTQSPPVGMTGLELLCWVVFYAITSILGLLGLAGLGYVCYLRYAYWPRHHEAKSRSQLRRQRAAHAMPENAAPDYGARRQSQESRAEERAATPMYPRKFVDILSPSASRPEPEVPRMDPYELSKRLEKVEDDIIRIDAKTKGMSGVSTRGTSAAIPKLGRPGADGEGAVSGGEGLASLRERIAALEVRLRGMAFSADKPQRPAPVTVDSLLAETRLLRAEFGGLSARMRKLETFLNRLQRSMTAPDEAPSPKEPIIADRMDPDTLKALDGMLAVATGSLETEARKDWTRASGAWKDKSAPLAAKTSAIRKLTTGMSALLSSQGFADLMDPADPMTPALRAFCDDMKARLKELDQSAALVVTPREFPAPTLKCVTPEVFYGVQLQKDPGIRPDSVRDAFRDELNARVAEARAAFRTRIRGLLPEDGCAETLRRYEHVLTDRIPRLIDHLEAIERKQVDSGKGDSPIRRGCVEVINGVFAAAGFEEIQVKEREYPDLSIHDVATSGEPVSDKYLEGKVVRVFRRGYRMGKDVIKRPMVVIGAPDVGRSAAGDRKTS